MSNPHAHSQPHRPPVVGPSQNVPPPMHPQFRSVVPPQPPQKYIPSATQHYRPVAPAAPASNVGFLFPQPLQHPPGRPVPLSTGIQESQGPVGLCNIPQVIAVHGIQESQPLSTVHQPPHGQASQNHVPDSGNRGIAPPSYNFAPSAYGLQQPSNNTAMHHQSISQVNPPNIPVSEACVVPFLTKITASVSLAPSSGQQAPDSGLTTPASDLQPKPVRKSLSVWMEHTKADGRRYYYNKKTRMSTWEKPLELMTEIERADATTDWKEYRSPEGRKFYYNKVTEQSKWNIPVELQLAREKAVQKSCEDAKMETGSNSLACDHVSHSVVKPPSAVDSSSRLVSSIVSADPLPVAMIITSPAAAADGLFSSTAKDSRLDSDEVDVQQLQPPAEGASGSCVDSVTDVTAASANEALAPAMVCEHTVSVQLLEVADNGRGDSVTTNAASSEEKAIEGPVVYPSKQDARNAFKELLKSANVESDWTWEQAMPVIVNDKRYGALRTLGEKKQAFIEYLSQRKKREAEGRRAKQKKARGEFRRMLEECSELTSATRWSKVVSILGEDERFKAFEGSGDCEEIFKEYLSMLKKKELAKAAEERRHNLLQYRQFLETCDFIKASSQWRKVQDRLESDERCACLEKIDRLEVFQEYVRDLEKQEAEQLKIQKEAIRKAERKNRYEFRKLLEDHVAAGTLNAKTSWREFHSKVKHESAYLEVSSNSSGLTAKELFEDVVEELEKQFQEDKSMAKEALKLGKIIMRSTWTVQDMKAAIEKETSSQTISDTNLKLVFDELIVRAREKEEKEAKKRKRLGDEFYNQLCSLKDITAASKWEEALPLFEQSEECRSVGDEVFFRQIFEDYVGQLKEIRERKQEEKARKRKWRTAETSKKQNKRSRRAENRDKEHHKWIQDADIEMGSDRSGQERSRTSRKYAGDGKRFRQGRGASESDDDEARHKRLKRRHQHDSWKRVESEDLEDGEVEIV